MAGLNPVPGKACGKPSHYKSFVVVVVDVSHRPLRKETKLLEVSNLRGTQATLFTQFLERESNLRRFGFLFDALCWGGITLLMACWMTLPTTRCNRRICRPFEQTRDCAGSR
jgi:hypothetical protein